MKHLTSPIGPACVTSPVANAPVSLASLPRCSYHESGGARCEREKGHKGGHAFDDAFFEWLQLKYRELHGPICYTRRNPPPPTHVEWPWGP